MSTLLDHAAGIRRPADGTAPPSPISAPMTAAVRAAAGSLVPVLVPVVAGWVLGAGGESTWIQAVRLALGLWLLGHHAGLEVAGGHVGLVPLGLAALPLVSCWFAGRRLARTMDPQAERIAAGTTRARPVLPSPQVLATFCVSYAVIAGLASAAAAMPGMRPITSQAVFGAVAISAVGGVLGACAYRFGGPLAGVQAVVDRLPDLCGPWVRPAAAAVGVQLAAAAVLVGVLVGIGATRVLALQHALNAGHVGGAVLILGELLLLPNLVLWGSAAMAGPGFAVGAGTAVTLGSTTLGPLPAIPVLAALPAPGTAPRAVWALIAVPVVAGAVAGVLVRRQRPTAGLVSRLGGALGATLACGLVMTLLSWWSGGPGGPGRLAEVGPPPLLTGAAVTVLVGAGATSAVLLASGLPWLGRQFSRAGLSVAIPRAHVKRHLTGWWPGAGTDRGRRLIGGMAADPAGRRHGTAWWRRALGRDRD